MEQADKEKQLDGKNLVVLIFIIMLFFIFFITFLINFINVILSIKLIKFLLCSFFISYIWFRYLYPFFSKLIKGHFPKETQQNIKTNRGFDVLLAITMTQVFFVILIFHNGLTLGEAYRVRAKVTTFYDSDDNYRTKLRFSDGSIEFYGYRIYSMYENVDSVTALLRDGAWGISFFVEIDSLSATDNKSTLLHKTEPVDAPSYGKTDKINNKSNSADIHITGKIYSDSEGPLLCVSVTERDSSSRIVEAALTDSEGNFSMDVKNTSNYLMISYAGYKTKKLKIGSRRKFNIELVKAH